MTSGAANAGTLIPVVPVSGSTSIIVGDINDTNVLVGTYVDSSGSRHAFTGSLDGNYITFDGGPNGTIAASINDEGCITGDFNADHSDATQFVPFERLPDGTILDVTKRGKQLYGLIGGVNNRHETFVGSQWSVKESRLLGYFGKAGEYRKPLTLSIDAVVTAPKDIN